ncbi:Extracellular serine protease precursor [Aminobacter sp. MSH1]|nr:Extracellular serine protease precursor [Aminobacter sp. MSH1]
MMDHESKTAGVRAELASSLLPDVPLGRSQLGLWDPRRACIGPHRCQTFVRGSVTRSVALLLLAGTTICAAPAIAGGGTGGIFNSAGGADSATGPGGTGADGPGGIGGGGGGGGAGAVGGSGGNGSAGLGGTGGAGGPSAGADGGNGAAGSFWERSGGGGGGGAHGSVGAILPAAISTGGAGGNGGTGGGGVSGGGGGGAGGFGAVATGSGNLGTVGAAVTGGDGGDGGSAQFGGSGGSGGTGLLLTSLGGVMITIDSTVAGGNGGASGGGSGGSPPGLGGAGLVGANLTVTNRGIISGGLSGDGGTRADAIVFTGGDNFLTLANSTSGITGRISVTGSLTFDQPTGSTLDQTITGSGSVTKAGIATLILTGTSTYTGATTVSDGTLVVDGSIASSSLTSVENGGILGGIGFAGATTVSAGGVFASGHGLPGTSMTLSSLTMQPGAFYAVVVDPASSSYANVTGNASLGGATVAPLFASGSYVAKQYTILTAGSITGTFNPTTNNGNLPSGFHTSLSYDTTRAYLDLELSFVPPTGTGLSDNQRNVGDAIVDFFDTNGSIPMVFGGLTPAGLTQLSGEIGTGAQQATFYAMDQFVGVITDPFITGRGVPVGGDNDADTKVPAGLAYAEDGGGPGKRNADAALSANASPHLPVEQPWRTWVAGYGGSQLTDGNASVGSNDTRTSLYGFAVGADYSLSPDTVAGFALAGGSTSFSVAGLGSGSSDLFQAGAFFRHNAGAAYLTGALAYGRQDFTTDRFLTVSGTDHLRAEFDANAWSGRLEGGYRLDVGGVGFTPYAAGQFTAFDMPSYAEQTVGGSNTFALSYESRSVTDTRAELGLRMDKSFDMADGVLTLRGRLAWAHNFNPDRSLTATFQTLPGASFVVNGAAMAPDSALITAAVEKRWLNGWSAAASFEGEFSNVTRSYSGKGVLRYAW